MLQNVSHCTFLLCERLAGHNSQAVLHKKNNEGTDYYVKLINRSLLWRWWFILEMKCF